VLRHNRVDDLHIAKDDHIIVLLRNIYLGSRSLLLIVDNLGLVHDDHGSSYLQLEMCYDSY
jgi:hypothetical protein